MADRLKMKLFAVRRKEAGAVSRLNCRNAESFRPGDLLSEYHTIAAGVKAEADHRAANFRDMGSWLKIARRLILISSLTFILCVNAVAKNADRQPPENIISNHNGTIAIESRGSALEEILDRLRRDYAVEINGLEHKKDTPVTFSHTSDSLEGVLKALLRHLGEKNYAFEFIDQKLRRISVFPGTQSVNDPPATEERPVKSGQGFVAVAEVQAVVEGSQAEALGIIPGDVIVAYDGVEIHNALQLVKEVEKKTSIANIEMVVIRNNSPIRFALTGGLIGVRIQTKQIPSMDYEKFNLNDVR